MQTSVSALRGSDLKLAVKLYNTVDYLSTPRFAHRRLCLPCIVFPVTEVRLRPCRNQETYFTYEVKVDKLYDLLISTEDRLSQFSHARPTRQSFLLVRSWDRHLLGLPDFEDNMQSEDGWTALESPSQDSLGEFPGRRKSVDSELINRALR